MLLKHVPPLMVGEHGGHCFLVEASGLSQVLSVRIGPAFSCNPVFRFNKDRTYFPEPSRRCIAAHRSRSNGFCCTETSAPVASSARQGMSWAVLNRSFADEPNSGIGLSAFEHEPSQNERTSSFSEGRGLQSLGGGHEHRGDGSWSGGTAGRSFELIWRLRYQREISLN